ncbi:methyl-accepting chemotaxis protein [Bacillus manliponensis]|uniref:methyl-accepting chemotaxis protein n=1 Tax=Bacillus manliponensis TaxID=574376 RepID=UPI0035152631
MMNFWKKMSFFKKSILLTVLVVFMLVGGMTIFSFNIFQKSMMNLLEERAMETGEIVLSDIDESIVKELAKDPTGQRIKQERMTEQLEEVTEKIDSVAQVYITGAKLNEKKEVQIVGMTRAVRDATKLENGDYYIQPAHWIEAYNGVLSSKKAKVTDIYEDELGSWVTILKPVMDNNNNIVAIVASDLDASVIPNTKRTFLIQISILIAVFLVITMSIQFFVIRASLAPLQELREGLRKVGEGDLNVHLNERLDDIGIINTYFNNSIEKFRKIIDKVKETADQVSASSSELSASTEENNMSVQEIASSMENLHEGAKAQKVSVQQCLGIVNKMEMRANEIADATQHVAKASEGMENHSAEGNEVIVQIINQMNLIQRAVKDLSSIIYSLENRSQQISDIVTVITGISNQTNLLALNASIEASRAGEAGRGFAVVAEEVRKLAEQTETSAKDISKLISETQAETVEAVASMQKGATEVESGISLVHSSGAFFEKIAHSAQNVTKQVKEVSETSNEISKNNQEVVHFVNELAHVAKTYEESSSYVEESVKEQEMSVQEIAELATSLSMLSQELQDMIGEFKS